MLILLSPAKSLDESPYAALPTTVPDFLDRSETLIRELCTLSIAEIRSLMKISQNLATLNKGRYQRFHRPFTPHNAKPAALMFRGDVYRGLQFDALKAAEQNYSQLHLRILSGLYGLLRPLDLIQPYRLEMGTRLSVGDTPNLYQFWGHTITESISTALAEQGGQLLINLASNEYFKAVKPTAIAARVITPGFKEQRDGQYKWISFYAKKARGSMARYLLANGVTSLDGLRAFDEDGYCYNHAISTTDKPIFTRVS